MLRLSKILICVILVAGFLEETAKAPPRTVYPVVFEQSPIGILTRLAERHGVPLANVLAIWQMEASKRLRPPNGEVGERGAFQVTKDVAADLGCPWDWDFEHSAECGIRYYKIGLQRCRDERRAGEFYNSGRCGGLKPGAYAVKFGMILARERGL